MRKYRNVQDVLNQLYEYLWFQEVRDLNYVIQLANNVHFRNADPVDHLEMIMAQARLQKTRELSQDLHRIFRGYR